MAVVDRLLGPFGRMHALVPALALFLFSLLLTFAAWRISDGQQERRLQQRFESQAGDIVAAISRRLRAYEQVLLSGAGLFDAKGEVTRAEWRRFTAAQRLEAYYPGIQGFGVSRVIRPDGLAAHEEHIRAEGFPAYRVRPEEPRGAYTAIVYLEPFNGRNLRAFGYDMFSEPVRREAMARAAETGEPAFSGIVTLVQETDADIQRGFLAYVPVYEPGRSVATPAERQAALRGWVYAPFRANDLMRGILGGSEGNIDIHVYDGPAAAPAQLLYDSAEVPGASWASSGRTYSQRIEVGGRQWTLVFVGLPDFDSAERTSLPTIVAVLGIAVDTMLFLGMFALMRSRQRERGWRQRLLTDQAAMESRFALALAATRAGTWEYHPALSRWDLSPGLAAMLGHDTGTVANLSHGAWMNSVVGRDLPKVVAWTRQLVGHTAAEAKSLRFRCLRLDGGVLTLEAYGARQQGTGHEVILRGIMRDVTQTALIEDAVHRAEGEVAAARARQSFLAVVSHEVRTPINGVLGLARLLLDTRLNAEQRDFAEMIVRSGESMLALVNDILDLSKMEAGKFTLEPGPCDVREMVDDVVAVMGARASEKRLALAARVAPDVPARIVIDESRLRQILFNLVGNAIKFTDEGGVIVEVETDAPAMLKFHVADTGPGLSEEQQRSLFQEYSQVADLRTKKSGGTGLGLSICRKLAEAMGGDAKVASEPDQGSVFTVSVRMEALTPPPPVSAAAGVRAAVAEPVALVAGCLARALADRGFAVAERLAPADVLLASWRLPAAAALRAMEAAGGRTVWLTAVDNKTVRGDSLSEPLRQSDFDTIAEWANGRVERLVPAPRGGRIADPLARGAGSAGRPLSILVVEDNVVNRRVLTGTLERHGHTCVAVENGLLALAELAARAFDIVIMDRHMPVLDGLETTQRVRAAGDPWRAVPILGLTASVAEEDLVACRAAGMNEVLTKPIDPEKLLAALRGLTAASDGPPHDAAGSAEPAQAEARPAPPSAAAFDSSAIDGLVGLLGAEGAASVLEDFKMSAEQLAGELAVAVATDDRAIIARVAHTIKSSSGTVGFSELSARAAEVEDGARGRANHDIGAVRRFAALLDQTIGTVGSIVQTVREPAAGGAG